MEKSNIISNYYITDYKALLRTTEQLFKDKQIQSYLTSEQNIILYELLKIENYEVKLKHWTDLLDGKLKLQSSLIENDHSVDEENKDEVIDEFLKMDLQNLQERLSSDGFLSALSLKIRYCLWEQPLKIWLQDDLKDYKLLNIYNEYKTSTLDSNDDNDDDILDDIKYVIMDSSENQDSSTNQDTIHKDIIVNPTNNKDDEDDYDMDEEEDIQQDSPKETEENDDYLRINISPETLSLLSANDINTDRNKAAFRFNKIYHTIEDDKTTVMGKKHLEEAEKRMEIKERKRNRDDYEIESEDEDVSKNDENTDSVPATNDEQQPNDQKEPSEISNKPDGDLIGDLSIIKEVKNSTGKKKKKIKSGDKIDNAEVDITHLLVTIEENRSKLKLTDQELRKLLRDVQKTGSKWASDSKIGQEELYEALEKVLNQLRSYGSYCQPFLNKVSKREAPNYYDIVKTPMDLNTMLRKLRNFRYNSKQEFVDDLNLIWKNCLTYNTDTKLLIRRNCSMMQKKASSLIPSIPDITIRDRKDVEAELYEEDNTRNEEPPSGKTNTNGKKVGSKMNASISLNTKNEEEEKKKEPDVKLDDVKIEEGDNAKVVSDNDDMIDDEDDVQDTGYLQMLNAEQLAFIDDAELTTWKNMTSSARSELLVSRSKLFIGNKLNPNADALMRNNKKMKNESQWMDDYDNEIKVLQQKHQSNNLSGSNAFNKHNRNRNDKNLLNSDDEDEENLDDVKIGTDNLLFLSEYNISNNLPDVPTSSLDNATLDKIENFIVKQNLKSLELGNNDVVDKPLSDYTSHYNTGMSQKLNTNIKLIQEIRHICHKISLIRDLQNRQAALIAQANNPFAKNMLNVKNKVFKPSIFRKMEIDGNVDLDFMSQLPTRNSHMNEDITESFMFKITSKLCMDAGFESTERVAVSTINEIACLHMNNLIKTIKLHMETNSENKINDMNELIEVSLLQNGVDRPELLYSYYEKNYVKKQKKLKEIKFKLNNFLKMLLRPSLKDLSERNFDDESSSYLTGDFSNELTGDDFFGFKELGLDKEFNIMNKSIPLHLLAVQMSDLTASNISKSIKLEEKEMNMTYRDHYYGEIKDENNSRIVGLMRNCLSDQWAMNMKTLNIKNDAFDKLSTEEQNNYVIKADDDLPLKLKAVRLATNGRISIMKKRHINDTIFLPEEEEQPPASGNPDEIAVEEEKNKSFLILPTVSPDK
ncbi:hypothetical protein ACO0R3_000541 [Hanseniaspora guilliermondii]